MQVASGIISWSQKGTGEENLAKSERHAYLGALNYSVRNALTEQGILKTGHGSQ